MAWIPRLRAEAALREAKLHDFPHISPMDRQQHWSRWIAQAYPDDEAADQHTLYTVEQLGAFVRAHTRGTDGRSTAVREA